MNSNNYKYKNARSRMKKKGQVTIFIIIALIIIAVFIFLILLRQNDTITDSGEIFSPEKYLSDCISPAVNENIDRLAKSGGYAEPEGTLNYNGEVYKYLCYNAEDYLPCIVQQPLIKEQFEKDLNTLTKSRAESCVSDLKEEYGKRGYSATFSNPQVKFYIQPQKIKYEVRGDFSIRRGDEARRYEQFNTEIKSEIYDLLFISTSIIDYESTYGDSETTAYLQYYPDLKINKIRLSEGSKIYKVSDTVTGEEFRFATRSLVFPPGYGTQ